LAISDLKLTGALKEIVGKPASAIHPVGKLLLSTLPRISANAEKITTEAMEIRKANKAGVKIGADTIYQFVESMIGFTEEIVALTDTVIYELLTPIVQKTINVKPKTVRLKEDMRTYFIFARASNEVVLDLKGKKYASALVNALELSGKLGVNPAVTQISTSISRLGMLKQTENFKTWHMLVDSIINGRSSGFKITPALTEAAFLIYGELKKIERYDRERNATPLGDVSTLYGYVLGLTTAVSTAPAVPTNVKAIVESNKFKDLLISYYGGVALDNLVIDVTAEMKASTYDVFNSTKKESIFSNEEINRVDSLIVTYARQIYQTYIIDGHREEGRVLIHQKEILHQTIRNTLDQLPQSFNMRVHPEILKLIHFVNDMAAAKDAEDMEKAIDAFALPSGSYSIKRTSRFNFSLNSFPGLIQAAETSWTASDRSTAFSFGFTAPVGLCAAWGTTRGYSWGVFLPVIDIGAVTRLRLDSDSNSATLPELTFKNFLSPGLYLHFGLKKSPVSFHVGAQFGPEVRRRLDNSSTNDTWESIRYGVGVVLDIPLLNLSTKPRFQN
jgi:hypothetical protein